MALHPKQKTGDRSFPEVKFRQDQSPVCMYDSLWPFVRTKKN